jgi:hypothetical protein
MAPSVSSRRRPDLLSPCRGDLRPARAAFDRKPRLWPDCRFVARPATGSRLLLRRPAGPEQESPIVADREATRLVVRECSHPNHLVLTAPCSQLHNSGFARWRVLVSDLKAAAKAGWVGSLRLVRSGVVDRLGARTSVSIGSSFPRLAAADPARGRPQRAAATPRRGLPVLVLSGFMLGGPGASRLGVAALGGRVVARSYGVLVAVPIRFRRLGRFRGSL